MEAILFYLAVITLVLLLVLAIEAGLGNRSIGFLKDKVPSQQVPGPRVSVLIPARNEEQKIQEGLTSVLAQDYENLEIIVLDDRSSDGTGQILSQMESRHPHFLHPHLSQQPSDFSRLQRFHASQLRELRCLVLQL